MRIGKVQDWKGIFKPLGQFILSLGERTCSPDIRNKCPSLVRNAMVSEKHSN